MSAVPGEAGQAKVGETVGLGAARLSPLPDICCAVLLVRVWLGLACLCSERLAVPNCADGRSWLTAVSELRGKTALCVSGGRKGVQEGVRFAGFAGGGLYSVCAVPLARIARQAEQLPTDYAAPLHPLDGGGSEVSNLADLMPPPPPLLVTGEVAPVGAGAGDAPGVATAATMGLQRKEEKTAKKTKKKKKKKKKKSKKSKTPKTLKPDSPGLTPLSADFAARVRSEVCHAHCLPASCSPARLRITSGSCVARLCWIYPALLQTGLPARVVSRSCRCARPRGVCARVPPCRPTAAAACRDLFISGYTSGRVLL